MPVSVSDEDYFTIYSQEIQPNQYPYDHDLPATPMVNSFGDINATVNKVNGWERLHVDTGHSLGQFQSTPCLLIDSAPHETEVLFNSLLMKECGLQLQKNTNIFARHNITSTGQGTDTIDAMTHNIDSRNITTQGVMFIQQT